MFLFLCKLFHWYWFRAVLPQLFFMKIFALFNCSLLVLLTLLALWIDFCIYMVNMQHIHIYIDEHCIMTICLKKTQHHFLPLKTANTRSCITFKSFCRQCEIFCTKHSPNGAAILAHCEKIAWQHKSGFHGGNTNILLHSCQINLEART